MIRPYQPGDLYLILPFIRESELLEAVALGEEPFACLSDAIYAGETVTLEMGGEVCGLAGVVNRGDFATPWAVFTSKIDEMPVTFLRESRRWMARYDMPMLNVVDERNKTTQAWLSWLGFSMSEPFRFGANGEPFRKYWKGNIEDLN